MDELELLKKDWQKKGEQLPKLSYKEIYTMLWKRSSSIVKWIFYISIIEFLVPHLIYFLPAMSKSLAVWKDLGLGNYLVFSTVLQYTIVLYFIFQFYKRYKEISALDDAKQLMKNILKTRKTVKYYVIFCLSLILISFLVMAGGIYLNEDPMSVLGNSYAIEQLNPEKLKVSLSISIVILGFVVTLVMGFIYFLLYGILLKKLLKNFKELQDIDV
ncbi:hypothetical protein HCG49_07245 [Arenibacter sp. 6A1]|uniref:hypothetical protein n=1 Tax=Arenibacter sp. 6A1 TaxID=2720391 RepID=UPI001444FD46|nr:hypothetical protein [Arenibacter sp. 6A1]NKI26355.1 hypothetical protein [Arenibacter sp. 6A1]